MLRFLSMDFLFRKHVGFETVLVGSDMNSENEEFDKDWSGP
jgi:hypothetical protein